MIKKMKGSGPLFDSIEENNLYSIDDKISADTSQNMLFDFYIK